MKILSDTLKLRHKSEDSVETLPALMMLADKISGTILHGMHSQRKSGIGEKFWQFRDYQQTDLPQDIDWRQSAKGDHIFIKQKELQTTQRTYLWCASGASMNFSSNRKLYSKQACAQIITLSLALILGRSEEQVGLFGDLKTGNSEDKMQKIGRILFDKANTEEDLPNITDFSLPNHSSFIAVGDFLSPIDDIDHSFSSIALSAQKALIVQVLDPAEIGLTYSGRIKFKGLDNDKGNDKGTVINHIPSVRDEYKKIMQTHINQVKTLCHENGWSYILHITDRDITQTLKNIWMIMDNNEASQ